MNKHEYEINQLINPKKDIVKSNSKHRDKIETLILGRRIGGIVGGGEPPKNILKDGKYKYDFTKHKQYFVACDVRGGRVFVYANSLGGLNNLNIYSPEGNLLASTGSDDYLKGIENRCKEYDNFVDVNKEVNVSSTLEGFNDYIEI